MFSIKQSHFDKPALNEILQTVINITSALKDLSVIASKETAYQLGKANGSSVIATTKLAERAATLRQLYEQKLKVR